MNDEVIQQGQRIMKIITINQVHQRQCEQPEQQYTDIFGHGQT